jgi:hypothetical protein
VSDTNKQRQKRLGVHHTLYRRLSAKYDMNDQFKDDEMGRAVAR